MDRRVDRRTVAKGAGALAGVAAIGGLPAVAEAGQGAQTSPAEPSLYDRLGGYFAIAAVVNRFSDEIITNPKLNENPALREWNETQAEGAAARSQVRAHPVGRVGRRRTLRIHRVAAERGSR